MNSQTAIQNEPHPVLQTVASVDRQSTPLLVADNTSEASGEKGAPNFQMICQPICRVGGPAWVEMLIRGTGPDARQSPMEIVQRGYRSAGLEFDLMVLDAALVTAAGLQPDTRIGVNIRPCSLGRPDFVQALQSMLMRRRIAPNRLVLELIEYHGPVRLHAARQALRRLRRMQVKIALDDFGPGYPNLDVIAEGLVDFVKLDRSLITALDQSPHQTGVLQGITALAKSTGVALVAEGIETPGQMNALKRLGIEWMQGFLFGRPTTLRQTRSCSPDTATFNPRAPEWRPSSTHELD